MRICCCRKILLFLVLAAFSAVAFAQAKVQLVEPLEWLYPDSKIGEVGPCTETDVPANGVAEVNILFNGLDPDKPVSFNSSAECGEWFRLVAVPVEKNTGPEGFVENIEKGRERTCISPILPSHQTKPQVCAHQGEHQHDKFDETVIRSCMGSCSDHAQ